MVKAAGNPARFTQVERNICLRRLDAEWIRHIASMEKLREVITYQAIGMRDPIVEYRTEAARMFQEMLLSVENETAEALVSLGISCKMQEGRPYKGQARDVETAGHALEEGTA